MSFLSLLEESSGQRKKRPHAAGRITAVRGSLLFGHLPSAKLGDICIVQRECSPLPVQVVSFERDLLCFAPLGVPEGIACGAKVERSSSQTTLELPDKTGGLVVNALGEPISDCHLKRDLEISLSTKHHNVLSRPPICERFITGIKSIDLFTPLGKGQRMGLFASAGLGKSTLLGMLARHCSADVIVLALIGERGREVREFIEDCLGPEGFKRTIIVVSTSDEPALKKAMAAKTACSIAEHYREQGKDVLLLFDSLTRFARAIRDVGLASGEMPVRQGLTPSVYSELPLLLERAGTSKQGSITAIYTVLTEEEHQADSLAGEIRSLLDGHIELDRTLFEQGYRPSIDISRSLSRLENKFAHDEMQLPIGYIRKMFGRLKRDRDLILLGGSPDQDLKHYLDKEPTLKKLLNQPPETGYQYQDTVDQLNKACLEIAKRSASSGAITT